MHIHEARQSENYGPRLIFGLWLEFCHLTGSGCIVAGKGRGHRREAWPQRTWSMRWLTRQTRKHWNKDQKGPTLVCLFFGSSLSTDRTIGLRITSEVINTQVLHKSVAEMLEEVIRFVSYGLRCPSAWLQCGAIN